MAYSDSFPSQRPSFMFDASNAGRIPPNMTYSRSTTGTYFGTTKHESSQNLVLQSQDLDTSPWVLMSGINGSLTGSQAAPDGTSTAWLATAGTTASTIAAISQDVAAIASGEQMTASAYVKAGTATHAYVILRSQYNYYAWAQLEFASPSSVTTGGNAFSNITGNVVAHGNGWYRISVSATTVVGTSAVIRVGMSDGSGWNASGYVSYTPTGETFYAWGVQLEKQPSSTAYNATTTQIHREYAPTLQTAATNSPRFEYSADGESMGILIEGSATNLIPYSTSQTMTAYEAVSAANAGVAPDGNTTATLVTWNSSTDRHYAYPTHVSVSSGTVYTGSAFIKATGGLSLCQLTFSSTAFDSTNYVNFNLTGDGSVTSEGGGATGSISSAGNGWYRVSITATATSSATAGPIVAGISSATDSRIPSYTANSYGGLLCWGWQLETGQMSSFIATSASTATRAADSLSMPIASTGYTGGPLTLLADSTTETAENNPVTIQMYVDGDNQIVLYGKSPNNRVAWVEADGSYSTLTTSSAANGVRALSIDTNDIATALNGTVDATDTSQTLPDLTGATVYFGDDQNGGNSINGTIKRIAIYSEALSDANIQSLTK